MPVLLTESAWSMQPEATSSTQEPAPSGQKPPAGRGDFVAQPLVMMAVMVGIFYFLLFRPQQKRQRETDQMLKSLKRGDKVRTSGGIRGEILELTDTEVTLRIDDKVKVNVLRSHIASRAGAEAKDKEKDKEKEKA